jgi:uncharacterized RDD family membrane protein YckC
VDLQYDLGGLGSRFVAALIDTMIQVMLFLVLSMGLLGGTALLSRLNLDGEDNGMIGVIGVALFALASFALIWGYYVFFEVVWSGQTPGKRVMSLRVVTAAGQPIGFFEALIRNIVRIADFLPALYVLGTTVMLLNSRSRRLGDFAAGTIVVKERHDIALGELRVARAAPAERQDGDVALNWSALTPQDYVLVREFLLRRDSLAANRRRELAGRIAAGLAARLELAAPDEPEEFLSRLADDYNRR